MEKRCRGLQLLERKPKENYLNLFVGFFDFLGDDQVCVYMCVGVNEEMMGLGEIELNRPQFISDGKTC